MVLDEQKLDTLVAECQQSGNFSPLKQTLLDVFSSADSLGNSWPAAAVAGSGSTAVSSNVCDSGQGFKKMTKEETQHMICHNLL